VLQNPFSYSDANRSYYSILLSILVLMLFSIHLQQVVDPDQTGCYCPIFHSYQAPTCRQHVLLMHIVFADFWFCVTWLLNQVAKLNPIKRDPNLDLLRQQFDLP
jgi:hypothetical protein